MINTFLRNIFSKLDIWTSDRSCGVYKPCFIITFKETTENNNIINSRVHQQLTSHTQKNILHQDIHESIINLRQLFSMSSDI